MHTPKTRNGSSVAQKAVSCVVVLTGGIAVILGLVLLQRPQRVQAASSDLALARSTYPNITGTQLDSCSLCHTSAPSLNSYGQAYKNAGRNQSALKAIESQDSDGDGFTNIAEINALTFPGSSSSKPAAATATRTPTRTATRAATAIATATSTSTPTRTPTRAATSTSTPTRTATTVSATATTTATRTATLVGSTPAATRTPTPAVSASPTAVGTPGSTLVLTPIADAYVNRSHASTNYGSQKTLRVDQSPVNRAFLRFQLAGIDLTKVSKAELRVWVVDSSNRGFAVRNMHTNSWTETKITYANQPSTDNIVARSVTAVAGKWLTVDITAFVTGAGDGDHDDDDVGKSVLKDSLSMALVGLSNDGFSIASRESGSYAPQLILTFK